MNAGIVLLVVLAALVLWWLWRLAAARRERARLLARPFPEAWRAILERNVPLTRRLGDEYRRRLEGLIQRFLADVAFEGCGGLEIDDEIRVTIAGQACLLLVGGERRSFPGLRSILVYPSTYGASSERGIEGGFVAEGESWRLGESWGSGYVVLAWDAVLHGASDLSDGRNVVFHEFAHQIDQADGAADGVPAAGGQRYGVWTRVLERDFEKLVRRLGRGRRTVLDGYAATNRAEFFAVATETFFEKPRALKARYQELYELLVELYGFDPADWHAEARRQELNSSPEPSPRGSARA